MVMLRAWGLWLVLTMLSYEASEEKLKADQSSEWQLSQKGPCCFKLPLHIAMIQPVDRDLDSYEVMKMSQ